MAPVTASMLNLRIMLLIGADFFWNMKVYYRE